MKPLAADRSSLLKANVQEVCAPLKLLSVVTKFKVSQIEFASNYLIMKGGRNRHQSSALLNQQQHCFFFSFLRKLQGQIVSLTL